MLLENMLYETKRSPPSTRNMPSSKPHHPHLLTKSPLIPPTQDIPLTNPNTPPKKDPPILARPKYTIIYPILPQSPLKNVFPATATATPSLLIESVYLTWPMQNIPQPTTIQFHLTIINLY